MSFQSGFAAGFLWGTSGSYANPTPRLFAALQDVTVTDSRDVKPLYGQGRYPIEQALGKSKLECKASIGRIDPVMFNEIYFGAGLAGSDQNYLATRGSITSGATSASAFEQHAIPGTPFQVAASAAVYSTDLGVFNYTTNKFMTFVTSGPTTGQYTQTAGTYTFAAADTGQSVGLSYTHFTPGASNHTLATLNPTMGQTVLFRADLFNSFRGVPYGITLWACQSSKLDQAFKQDDFMLPALDFSAQEDLLGNVMSLYGSGPS